MIGYIVALCLGVSAISCEIIRMIIQDTWGPLTPFIFVFGLGAVIINSILIGRKQMEKTR